MVTALLTLLLGILVVVLITLATGYFVAQEFAYMAVDRSRLKAQAEAGDKSSARALTVTSRTSFMLSGAQLGITVTGLLVGYVAEPLIGQSIGTLLGGVNVPAVVGPAIGGFVAIVFSTIIQMVFGELFPKNLSIARPDPVARWLAASTTVYLKVFGWLIGFFDKSSNLLLRALKIEPVHDVEHSANPDDLDWIVAESTAQGDLPRNLSLLLDRVLDFPRQDAEHAMIPRARVDVVSIDESPVEVREKMGQAHTRYPVYGETFDDIRGVVHMQDLLREELPESLSELIREPIIVPESLPLPQVVSKLADAREVMAIVVDEYGGFAGVITLEDLAEELVGEIDDEHDLQHVEPVVKLGEDLWHSTGDAPLDEVERQLDIELPEGDYETLAGLVISEAGDLPKIGDEIIIELPGQSLAEESPLQELYVLVEDITQFVPSSLKLQVRESVPADADSDEDNPDAIEKEVHHG